jgi:hypothetical protein
VILDEEVYLEHYGVKGMRWGVRKDASGVGKYRTPEEKAARKRKAVSISVGLAFVALRLYQLNSMMKPSTPRVPRNVTTYPQTKNVLKIPKPPHYQEEHYFKISPNARKTLMDQERQRNGALKVRQMLKDMGEDVL